MPRHARTRTVVRRRGSAQQLLELLPDGAGEVVQRAERPRREERVAPAPERLALVLLCEPAQQRGLAGAGLAADDRDAAGAEVAYLLGAVGEGGQLEPAFEQRALSGDGHLAGMMHPGPSVHKEMENIACTLSGGDLGRQRARWTELRGRAGLERILIADGLELVFVDEPGVEDTLRELVAVENECCSWASWDVVRRADAVVMTATSTGHGVATLHSMFR